MQEFIFLNIFPNSAEHMNTIPFVTCVKVILNINLKEFCVFTIYRRIIFARNNCIYVIYIFSEI
jgi:hypothetical protein